MKAYELFDIENPTREQVYSTLFRPDGWGNSPYSGLYLLDFGISDDEKVLDVGGGNKPYPRANVVVEKFMDDASQRGNKAVTSLPHQTLVEGSIDNLPFEDKSFDFIYTSHTLEHADDLGKALNELSRVGKRGYCALPLGDISTFTDHIDQGHKWLCRYNFENSKFYYRKKLVDWELCDDFSKFHVTLHTKNVSLTKDGSSYTSYFENKYRYLWEIRFVWKDNIKHKEIEI